MNRRLRKKMICSALAIPAVAWALASCAAQSASPPSTQPDSTANLTGLDALTKDDRKLIDELQNDGLDSLLLREFDVNNTPQAQRDAIMSLKALRQLNDPNAKLTDSQRLALARQAADGILTVKGSLPKDANRLAADAHVLLLDGANHYENTLEYWGDNPVTQSQLRPIAEAINDLLKMASDAAEAESLTDAQANNLKGAMALDEESQNLEYSRNMAAYFRALSADDKDQRKQIVSDAVDALKPYDVPNEGVQGQVRMQLAKLYMTTGDAANAAPLFDTIIANTAIQPPVDIFTQNDAHYFKAVAYLKAKDLAKTQKAMDDLLAFQKTLPDQLAKAGVPQNQVDADMKSLDAPNQMLRYRVDLLQSQLAKTPADKNTAQEAAVAELVDLGKTHPEFKETIYEQLVNSLPPDQPVAQMDPLLLQAVMNKGAVEYRRPAALRDTKVMQRAVDAAEEVVNRKDRTGISPEFASDAAKLAPSLDDALGDQIDAITGYLDYIDKNKTTQTAACDAMLQRAGWLTSRLRQTAPETPNLGPDYERLLRTAIAPPFNYTGQSYLLGKMLYGQNRMAEAADAFEQVPKTDPNYKATRVYLMVIYDDLADTPTRDKAKHEEYVAKLQTAATEVRESYMHATDLADRGKAASATEILANIAIYEQNDPQSALTVLDGFEDLVKGLPNEKEQIGPVLLIRVNAYMALGQTDKATTALVSFLNASAGNQGIEQVHNLLDKLDKEYNKAVASGDVPAQRKIIRNEAQLTGFLADWAKNNTNPDIKKLYYGYAVFDAKTKRIAGTLEDDPAAKKADLEKALAQFQNLASPAGHELYVAQLDPAKVNTGQVDPSQSDAFVEFGEALTQYELHDYGDAQATLSLLLNTKRLGDTNADTYWEATYKLYDCNYELAQRNDPVAVANLGQTKHGLETLYIFGGIPDKWADSFDSLRKKLIPDWKVPSDDSATQPSAMGK